MAHGHSENDENSSVLGRRSYLKLFAGAVGMASITGSAVAVSADTDTVVDLGERGLSDGDVIDDYLEEYFDSGVEVRIPEGTYQYYGSGLGGGRSDAALVGVGEVVFTNEVGEYRETIQAESGVVEIRNVTLRGAAEVDDGDEARFRLEADSDGRVLLDNFNLPDGVRDPGNAIGFYVPSGHAGVVEVRNCYVANFSNNGIYASSPGKGADGQVIVENCFFRNNNISGIRLGSTDSVARNCLVLNDKEAPHIYSGSSINMRGIRIREAGDNITIENCEIIHSYEGAGGPIVLHFGAEGGSGTIKDTLIRNETGTDAILEKGDAAAGWDASNVSITGGGDLDYPSNLDGICVGSGCPVPTGDDPQGGSSGSTTTETEVGTGGTELSVVTTNSDGAEYTFTTTGAIEPLYDRDRYSADTAAPADTAAENADGTWTATGATGGGAASGDSFFYDGTMTDFSATGDVDAITLYADGRVVTAEELIAAGSDDGSTDGGTTDGGSTDDGSTDGGSTDDGSTDGGSTDDGSTDGGSSDTALKTIILDGSNGGTVASYRFSVTGEVQRDSSISTAPADNRWDNLEDIVEGTQVDGVLGDGIDGYRFTGDIVEIEFDGAASVTIDGQ
ncbi:hypothetical protein DVK02_11415 [Halobellus sp. Atlit-31R]|nr:hypothetical protein DVK02_11415 [Halobellus sp. Atlit-31R]